MIKINLRKGISLIVIALECSVTQIIAQKLEYPIAPKDASVNTYFGTEVLDPYQWMENPNDPKLQPWLASQNKITTKIANQQVNIWKFRAQLATIYMKVRRETNENFVMKENEIEGGKYEFKRDTFNYDKQPDLLYRKIGEGNYRILIQNKRFKTTKDENVNYSRILVNEETNLGLVEISKNGSDWRTCYLFDLVNGVQLSDTLKNIRMTSNIVLRDNGVYYSGYGAPKMGRELLDNATGQKMYFHEIGTNQSDDVVLYSNPDPSGTNTFHFHPVDDKIFLYSFLNYKGDWFRTLSVSNMESESLVFKNFLLYPASDSIQLSIEQIYGDTVLIGSTWNAPNGRVLLMNVNQPNKPIELIPEFDIPLYEVNSLGKDKIACLYRRGGQNLALIFNLKGELLTQFDFPNGKKVVGFYEKDQEAEFTTFGLASFYHPTLKYQLSLKDLTYKPVESVAVPYNADELETRFVTYPSKDGTLISMFITCMKNTKLNGKNPTLLYGYGGYGFVVEPRFDPQWVLWLLHGGVLAVPNIRGGGTEGGQWALAGRRLNKQNTIDDFIGAAEYLIKERYTNPEKLGAKGSSHGGLLVGAAITQRPELFKTAIIEAGVLDMLRFENYTSGGASLNRLEFGTTSDSLDFINLRSYSPLHNVVKNVKYPNVLLMTGDQDDRVPPFHSYKFLATLQESSDPSSQSILYVTEGASHSGGATGNVEVDALLFKYYYLFDQLGLEF